MERIVDVDGLQLESFAVSRLNTLQIRFNIARGDRWRVNHRTGETMIGPC